MPIRFRCAYCNQLMGIARRKAGTVVRCPNCAGQVVVPRPNGGKEEEPAESKPVPAEGPPFFEQNDFDDALGYATSNPRSVAPSGEPDSGSRPVPAPATYQGEVESYASDAPQLDFPPNLPVPGAPPGILLSRAMATIVSVVIVIALAIAFVVGLIVGRALYTRPTEERAANAELRAEWRPGNGESAADIGE